MLYLLPAIVSPPHRVTTHDWEPLSLFFAHSSRSAFFLQHSPAKKLGVNMYQYVHDRMAQTNQFPSLATLIEERARDLQFAASWRGVT